MAENDELYKKINERLVSIESRLERLESTFADFERDKSNPAQNYTGETEEPAADNEASIEEGKGIESQIGRFGLAWMGNIVLIVGIIFLIQFLIIHNHRLISVLFGFTATASIFFLAEYLKTSNTHLSFIFRLNALLLLFYVTLRLHFFSAAPVISNKTISVILLLFVVAFMIYLSIRNRSQAFGTLSLLFTLTTAIVSDATHFMLPLVILTAGGAVLLFYKFNWRPFLILTLFLTYITFFLWLFGNPFMAHPMEMIAKSNSAVIYLSGIGACFSILMLLREKDDSLDDFFTGVIIINGALFSILLLLVVPKFYGPAYVPVFSLITVCCIIYSILLHSRSDWSFASAFYSLYGFMAMSIALYGTFGFPLVYLLLSVQSLIVVSMALWFHNRLIVVMNSLLFLAILALYLVSSKTVDGVNFSFAIVALISARIINWKKSRLQIKTDLIRNLYLIEGFFMVMFALFRAVPRQFVVLSWTLAALLYFVISIILKNVKYRYMALGTMICAAFYLFIVDLSRIELIYRVLALLVLAAISIGISIYYTNRTKKQDK